MKMFVVQKKHLRFNERFPYASPWSVGRKILWRYGTLNHLNTKKKTFLSCLHISSFLLFFMYSLLNMHCLT